MMQVSQQMAREINERCHMHNKKINNSKVVHTKCMVQNADIIFGAKKQALKNCNLRKIKINKNVTQKRGMHVTWAVLQAVVNSFPFSIQ